VVGIVRSGTEGWWGIGERVGGAELVELAGLARWPCGW